jgi:hypothetical protein
MKKIVIVGGGAAGWMAAITFASRFPAMRIVVVDPKVIGPIGVGESVTGVVMSFVTDPLHQLSLGDFFRRCDVTFKAGIWYKNWQAENTEYLTPIDSPPDYFAHYYATHIEEFFAATAADGIKLSDAQIYSNLMKTNRTDYLRNPDGTVNADLAKVSCHFDAIKFGSWLRENAVKFPNIEQVDDVIDSFEQDPGSGFVTKIRTRGGLEIDGEFFIDCTGFHRLLLAKAYEPRWLSYADVIRVDSAIPFFQNYADGQEMPTYTMASAMQNGWLWQIPTQSRLGRGYIFSSRYTDAEAAIAEIRSVGLEPGDNPRVIRFDPGRFAQTWIKNVCAVGLSGGFIEPLEASTIHGMYVQTQLLATMFLPYCTPAAMPSLAESYNSLVNIAYDDYTDFISFHYHAGRTDTEFWRDYQKPSSMTAANRHRYEKWQYTFPTREDFAGTFCTRVFLTTSMVVWAPMLCALGFLRRDLGRLLAFSSRNQQQLRENVARYIRLRNRITATALTHAEAIEYFRGLA